MTNFNGLYSIREGVSLDHDFIFSTFKKGLYYGDSWFSLIPKDIFISNYGKVIEHIVTSPNTTIVVACLPDDPSVILGYAVLSNDAQVLHWVYVKSIWRNKGIMRSLLPTSLSTITHLTKTGKSLMSKFPNAIFNPFQIP